jgi:WhiB family redox-sensing transcriptional regulator
MRERGALAHKPAGMSFEEAAALCAQGDPEAFFSQNGGSTGEAKQICRRCEVRAQCLEYALDHDDRLGIWSRLSEKEHRRLRGPAA